MKAELKQLVALQKTDISIRQLRAALDAIPHRRAEIEKEFDQRAFEFKAIETRRDEAREKRARLDAELAQLRAHAEKAERDLMSSTNEKAYTAAIREVDAARKHISTLETQILEQMEPPNKQKRTASTAEIANLRAEWRRGEGFHEQMRVQAESWRLPAPAGAPAGEFAESLSALQPHPHAHLTESLVAEAQHGSCTACCYLSPPCRPSPARRIISSATTATAFFITSPPSNRRRPPPLCEFAVLDL